jgi:hypothetical protein
MSQNAIIGKTQAPASGANLSGTQSANTLPSKEDSNPLTQTFGPGDGPAAGMSSSQSIPTLPDKKANKGMEKINKQSKASLPPGVEGIAYGSLFVEVGSMEWFTYDHINYLSDSGSETRPIHNLYANFKFWGEQTKGIFLKYGFSKMLISNLGVKMA